MIDFKVCELNHCKSLISDLTEYIEGYNKDKDKRYSVLYNPNLGYRLEDCIAIYVLTYVTSDGSEVVSVHLMDDPREELDVHFEKDGLYRVTKIVIPNSNILDNESFMDDEVWPNYGKTRYFYYKPMCKFFKLVENKFQEYVIRGKALFYDDRKDEMYKEPQHGERPKYLMIQDNDTFIEILSKHGHATLNRSGGLTYIVEDPEGRGYIPYTEEYDTERYVLFDIDSFDHRWLDKNICFKWDVPDKPTFPFFPKVDGYDYIPVEVDEIIESCDGWITTLRETKDVFSICKFRECVFMRNSEFIKDCPKKCTTPDNEDGLTTIMWLNSSLQALEFLLHCERFTEAMQLLEQLNVCGGPCSEFKRGERKGCGCGKK